MVFKEYKSVGNGKLKIVFVHLRGEMLCTPMVTRATYIIGFCGVDNVGLGGDERYGDLPFMESDYLLVLFKNYRKDIEYICSSQKRGYVFY